MADVRPFRAVRYADPSTAVTAPPYDVLDEPQRAELRARDPHNVVWLTADPDEAKAGRRFREWLAEGLLVRDETPAIWVLEQDVPDGAGRTRMGIAASLRAEPYSTGVVLPHEQTHAGTRRRRLRLLRAAQAQLEPLFFLYDGAPPLAVPDRAPDLEAGDTRLWRLDGDHGVTEAFAGTQLLIADGHHRYETAVRFAEEGGDARLLAVLVSTEDPGLAILPTHRVFEGRPDIRLDGEPFATPDEALAALAAEPFDHSAAVLVRRDATHLVRGGPGELDPELVERFGREGIGYTPDAADAVERVRSGAADCAFLLRATRIEDVFDHARRGLTMPPKSTYFFPKLLSGLLFHPLEP
ncbi:MAG TPA: DUF1015 domain-containing protein [Gaiella sp.]